jgi:hypothetical protein
VRTRNRPVRRTKQPRSELSNAAVKEYVARHAPGEVTEAMNRVCEDLVHTKDEFVSQAARWILERAEW